MPKNNERKPDVSSTARIRLIDAALEQCASELQSLAEVYHKHGMLIHARELFLASASIRQSYKAIHRDDDKAS